jgi:hypothetical protein
VGLDADTESSFWLNLIRRAAHLSILCSANLMEVIQVNKHSRGRQKLFTDQREVRMGMKNRSFRGFDLARNGLGYSSKNPTFDSLLHQ